MKKLITLLTLLFTINLVYAQNESETTSGEFWIGAQLITPMGSFKEKIERNLGYGGSLGGLWNPSKRNNFFQVGAEIGVLYFGKDKKTIDDINIKTTNTVILTHLIMRFRIQTTSNIRPYIDIIGGGKFFSTTTKYDNDFLDTLADIENQDIFGEQTNTAWSYGTGIGFSKINVDNVGLDIKLVYMRGSQTKYIAPENFFQDTNGDFFYENQDVNSTDMLSLSISFIGLLN